MFARGQTVEADNGMPARLRRPLDFLAVTDHAEYLGIYAQLEVNDPRLKEWKMGMEWQEMMKQGDMMGWRWLSLMLFKPASLNT